MTKPIRVLHILQRFEAAGVQKFLINLYNNIDREKVQFDFLVHYRTPQFFDKEIEKLGGRIYRFSVREDYNLIKYIRELNHFFKEHQEYKIVHGHMPVLGFIYLKIAKKYGIKVRIAHSHTTGYVRDKNLMKRLIKNITNRLYSKYATDLFACSLDAGNYMFGQKEFRVINNAIEIKKYIFNENNRVEKRKELDLKNEFVIGCVGRLEAAKNHRFAIEIFEKLVDFHPNSKLLFIGKGSLISELNNLVIQKKLENKVLFLGNRNDVEKLYSVMDVFLFPSLYEGLGMVGIESQAAGIPTICSDTLPKELNVTPLIYRISLQESPKSWAKLIISTKKNKYRYKDMSSFIKNANFDILKLAKEMQELYLNQYKE